MAFNFKSLVTAINPTVQEDFKLGKMLRIGAPFANNGSTVMYMYPNLDILHVPSGKLYTVDKGLPKEDVFYKDIPDLCPAGVSISALYVLATILKPLHLDSAVYNFTDEEFTGPKLRIINVEYSSAGQLMWTFPKGGIKVPDTDNIRYVPFIKDARVDKVGNILGVDNLPFVKGTNRNTYLVSSSTDSKLKVETTQEELVSLALGNYTSAGIGDISKIKEIDGNVIIGEKFIVTETVTTANGPKDNKFTC